MDAFYNIKNEVAELENRKIIRPRHLTEKLPIVKAHLSIRANNLLVSLNKSPMNMTEVAQQTALQKANATKYIDKMISKGFVYRFQKERTVRNNLHRAYSARKGACGKHLRDAARQP